MAKDKKFDPSLVDLEQYRGDLISKPTVTIKKYTADEIILIIDHFKLSKLSGATLKPMVKKDLVKIVLNGDETKEEKQEKKEKEKTIPLSKGLIDMAKQYKKDTQKSNMSDSIALNGEKSIEALMEKMQEKDEGIVDKMGTIGVGLGIGILLLDTFYGVDRAVAKVKDKLTPKEEV